MALTLHRLYENTWYLYEMNIIAGRKGMDNIVQWVHTLEDVETGEFIHGGELIFTTGIAQKEQDPHWLINFAKEIYSREASGIVVNIGPYIREIPQEVIDYCDEIGFPLLQIPWKTRIVDITRDFCNRIFEDEKLEEDVSSGRSGVLQSGTGTKAVSYRRNVLPDRYPNPVRRRGYSENAHVEEADAQEDFQDQRKVCMLFPG